VRASTPANLWSFSVFWCDRIEWPWNSRECKTINAECLATELLPCECVMRCPIASLCSAPMELGFGSSLARSFFKLAAAPRSTMSSPLLYAARSRPAPRSMITSERDIVSRAGNVTEPGRNSSMISRARGHAGTRAHAQGGVRSECVPMRPAAKACVAIAASSMTIAKRIINCANGKSAVRPLD